jgi:predicted 2-oxoglutarate/Fe(II)-dependent dioxygenase YbiX
MKSFNHTTHITFSRMLSSASWYRETLREHDRRSLVMTMARGTKRGRDERGTY